MNNIRKEYETATMLNSCCLRSRATGAGRDELPQGLVLVGNNCTLSAALGWITAGLGTDSILTIYVPPGASGPVDIEVTGMNSSLGSTYTGYFGFMGNEVGKPEQSGILTLSDIVAGASQAIGMVPPGHGTQFQVTQVCWDPTCTTAAPAGAVPNMFSLQLLFSSPNPGDVNPNDVQLDVRFLNGSQVTFEEQESALHANAPFRVVPNINLGATPATRYVYNGTAVTLPFDVLSVSNFSNPSPITGTVAIQDFDGHNIVMANIPAIPSGGAAGFLVIGRSPGDPLGLFPSSTVLPAGSDGIFHGVLVVGLNGLTPAGISVVLAQEFNGNTMLNLPIFGSAVP